MSLKVEESNATLTNNMRMYFLELPTFSKKREEDCTEKYQYWMYNLSHMRNMNSTQAIPFVDKQPIFNKVFNIAEVAAMTPEEARRYRISEKNYLDACALISEATKKGRKEGRKEGIKEGREEGRKEGIKEGIGIGEERGKKIARAEMKASFVLSLANKGMTMDFIVDVTGLTVDQVLEIISNNKNGDDTNQQQ